MTDDLLTCLRRHPLPWRNQNESTFDANGNEFDEFAPGYRELAVSCINATGGDPSIVREMAELLRNAVVRCELTQQWIDRAVAVLSKLPKETE